MVSHRCPGSSGFDSHPEFFETKKFEGGFSMHLTALREGMI